MNSTGVMGGFAAALAGVSLLAGAARVMAAERAATVLGIEGSRFTVNGKAVFLLGFSYYGGLGAPENFIRADLNDFQAAGFNWLRVWATWASGDEDASAVDSNGRAREPFLSKLKWLVNECDQRGLVVDITLSRDKTRLPNFMAHERGVETLVQALKVHRNWYLDLANERDVRDARYVSVDELKLLREEARRLDPQRLVTASFGSGDFSRKELREALLMARLDFLCPHRPRSADSPAQTEAKTRAGLALLKELGRVVPIHYQEPFRRGYTEWAPAAADFLADLRGALAGGAGGWCFHNGQERNAPDHRPRRCFDLREQRLFEQLDAQEREVVQEAGKLLKTK